MIFLNLLHLVRREHTLRRILDSNPAVKEKFKTITVGIIKLFDIRGGLGIRGTVGRRVESFPHK